MAFSRAYPNVYIRYFLQVVEEVEGKQESSGRRGDDWLGILEATSLYC